MMRHRHRTTSAPSKSNCWPAFTSRTTLSAGSHPNDHPHPALCRVAGEGSFGIPRARSGRGAGGEGPFESAATTNSPNAAMKDSMRAKLAQLARRLEEIDVALAQQNAARDLDQFRRLSRERADIEPVVARYHEYAKAQADLLAAQELIGDPEMRTLAEEESGSARRRMETLESDLQRLLLPVDPNDERNIFLEIRAGTGGEESALFAANLLRMYLRYAERQHWQVGG